MRAALLRCVPLLATLAWLGPLAAHPQGRASVNQTLIVQARLPTLGLALTLDMAETVTARELARIDGDHDGRVAPDEEARYLAGLAPELGAALLVRAGGRTLPLAYDQGRLRFFTGEEGFPTALADLRWTVDLAPWLTADQDTLVVVDNRAFSTVPGITTTRVVPDAEGADRIVVDSPARTDPGHARTLTLRVRGPGQGPSAGPDPAPRAAPEGGPVTPQESALLNTLRQGPAGWWGWLVALALAFFFGAVHALSPGHGKTLAAAFLLGRRARVRHALWLGAVVSVAHVVGVLVLGVASLLLTSWVAADRLAALVGAGSGLAIAVIGAWMWTRAPRVVSGLAWYARDHDHGQDHDHDHGQDHDHDHGHGQGHEHPGEGAWAHARAHLPPLDPGRRGSEPSLREILALGFSGGVAPCPTALVILLLAISLGRVALGLSLIVAFSLGLAAVLVAGGVAVVRLGEAVLARAPRAERAYPVLARLSAAIIVLLGVGLALQGLQQAGLITIHLGGPPA